MRPTPHSLRHRPVDPTGQHWDDSSGARGRHPLGHLVQAIAEQVAVLVRRHGRGGVSEQLLDQLHGTACGDREPRRGVPELVRLKARPAAASATARRPGSAAARSVTISII
jgi:hypothetical protein